MSNSSAGPCVAILGTGGTIAGVSTTGDDRHYKAAQLSVADLVAAVPELGQVPLRVQQVAQVDSKDMGWPVWQALLPAVQAQLQDPGVLGVVITHGTDTLEETALLLHLLLAANKPVVLTAAMRPATSAEADGPANLRDAVALVQWAAAQQRSGVVVALHGKVWSALEVRKAHSHAIDAFDGGEAEPLALVDEAGMVHPLMDGRGAGAWPAAQGWLADQPLPNRLPPVLLVTSHADADGSEVDAWRAAHGSKGTQGTLGVLVAGTGHGTIHQSLHAALVRAHDAGVVVWRCTRVARGGILAAPDEGAAWPACGALTPGQARLALALALQWRGAHMGAPKAAKAAEVATWSHLSGQV